MSEYFESGKGKWVMLSVDSGTGTYYQGILEEIGEDYIVISIRHIVSYKLMRIKENGKPRMFG
jgi:hypothetical protein